MNDIPTTLWPIDTAAVREQVDRVVRSEPFAASERLQQFLRFIVDEELAGRGGGLKEYAIGVHVYGRGDAFDPKADSIVRSEARRLRARLAAYYDGPGSDDAVVIALPIGRYVPTFRLRLAHAVARQPGQPPEMPVAPEAPAATASSPDRSPDPARSRGTRMPLWAAGAITVLLVVAFAGLVTRWPAPEPTRRVGLLIVPFERRVDVEVPAGALETAMEFELGRSRVVQVIPRLRVQDGLRLMKAPLDAPLTLDLAQQLAARDNGIGVILSGWLAPARAGVVLQLSLRDAATVRVIGITQQTIASPDEAVRTIESLAQWVRRTVRDGPAAPREGLERVATTSLAALESYQRGMDLLGRSQWVAAEAMFAGALQQDPEFASARIYHAWTLLNMGRPRDQVLDAVRRAEAASGAVGERERLFIRASARDIAGHVDEARALYAALLERYPDHWMALNNLTLHTSGADAGKAGGYWAAWADARPNDVATNLQAGKWLAFRGADDALVQRYLARARVLNDSADGRIVIDWLAASSAWRRGDVLPLREVGRQATGLRPAPQHAIPFGLMLMSTGHPSASERAFAVHVVPRILHRWGLVAAISQGDRDRITMHAAGLAPTRANPLSTILLAWAGALNQADMMAGRRQESMTPGANARQVEALWAVADGERQLSRGETTRARPLLERAHTELAGTAYPEAFIATRSLARLRLDGGDDGGARQLLRQAVAARTAAFESSVPFWIACAQDLIALERRGGDLAGAERLETQVRTLLHDAEPEFEPTRLGAFTPHHP